MEGLKPLRQVASADKRNRYFVVTDGKGKSSPLTLEQMHREVSAIRLHSGVPSPIRDHFAQAQNLAIYSWFYYPFNVTAQFMAFVSLEYALKQRTGLNKPLKVLIRKAVTEGWIKDERFSIARIREGDKRTSYVEVLIEAIPSLRNRLAHGSNMLHNSSITSLLTCAEFINQLFPTDG